MAPTPRDFSAWLQRVLADVIAMLSSAPKLASSRAVTPYLFHNPATAERLTLKSVLLDDDGYCADVDRIRRLIDVSCSRVKDFSGTFAPLLELTADDSELDVTEILQLEDPTAADLGDKLDILEVHRKSIAEAARTTPIGPFMVDTRPIAEVLMPVCQKGIAAVTDLIPQVASDAASAFATRCDGLVFNLETAPRTLADVAELLTFHNTTLDALETVEAELDEIHALYDLMLRAVAHTLTESLVLQKAAENSLAMLQETLASFPARRAEIIGDFTREFGEAVGALTNAVTGLWRMTVTDELQDRATVPDIALARLDHIKTRFTAEKADFIRLSGYGKLMQISVAEIPLLANIETEVRLKRMMWSAIKSLHELTSEFADVNIRDADMDRFTVIYSGLLDVLPALIDLTDAEDNEALQALQAQVAVLKKAKPLLDALSSNILLADDWAALREVLPLGDPITVEMLLAPIALEAKGDILAIVSRAELRHHVAHQLDQVAAAWTARTLTITRMPGFRDAFLLTDLETLRAEQADSLVTLATLHGNTAMASVRESVEKWTTVLTNLGETLTVWTATQTLWVYLFTIFNAPDIQRQLVSEARLFRRVDTEFRAFMKAIFFNPFALASQRDSSSSESAVVAQLAAWLSDLEIVRHGLGLYLEAKRRALPRLYFLSDDALLKMLEAARDPAGIAPFLPVLFTALTSIELEPGEGAAITGFGDAQEQTQLLTPLRPRGTVEYWLSHLDAGIQATLREQTLVLIRQPAGRASVHLIDATSFPAQVSLTAIKFYFTRDVDIAISRGVDALTDLKASTSALITSHAALLQENISPARRTVLGASIVTHVHHRDILERLAASDDPAADWTNELRLYISGERLQYTAGACTTPLSYEYVGNSSRLVVTPLTTRCWRTVFTALRLCCGTAPRGPAGTGKTETIKDLAKYLGRHVIVFNCGGDVGLSTMTAFFCGILQTGSFSCFDEFNRLSVSVISVVAEQLQQIMSTLRARAIDIQFGERLLKVDLNAGFFVTLNPGYAGRQELPFNVQALFRPCFVGDTIITRPNGSALCIDAMADREGLTVSTAEGRHVSHRPFSQFLPQGEKAVVTLTFGDGRTVTCTPDHRLRAINPATDELEWIEAQHLSTAQHQRVLMSFNGAPDTVGRDEKGYTLTLFDTTLSMERPAEREQILRLARLTGFMATDSAGEFTCSTKLTATLVHDDVVALCSAVHSRCSCSISANPDGTCRVTRPATLAQSFGGVAGSLVHPTFVIDPACPRSVLREYVAGLYGGHGCRPTLDKVGFNITTSDAAMPMHRSFVDQLHRMLCTVLDVPRDTEDISIAEDTPNRSVSVNINPRDLKLAFHETIGYRYDTDKLLHSELAASFFRYDKAVDDQRDVISVNPDYCFTRLTADEFLEKVVNCPSYTNTFTDSSSLNTPTFSLPVVHRKDAGTAPVFDITVPETENFIANGLVAHNCSMLVPDAKFIAEVLLHCSGFESSADLATKLSVLLDTLKLRLSPQTQYDYSLRTLKAAISIAAGNRWSARASVTEQALVASAVEAAIAPRLDDADRPIFSATLQDVFTDIICKDDTTVEDAIIAAGHDAGLSTHPAFVTKVSQLFDSVKSRVGTILVGPPGTGKSTAINILLQLQGVVPGLDTVRPVRVFPRALDDADLFGHVDASNEWHDGVLPSIIRPAATAGGDDEHWMICDGPVDAMWVEDLNTVLDDTRALTLAGGETIKIGPNIRMLFETDSLAMTSPATVSRCAIVAFSRASLTLCDMADARTASLLGPRDGKHIAMDQDTLKALRDDICAMIKHYLKLHEEMDDGTWERPLTMDPVAHMVDLLEAALDTDTLVRRMYQADPARPDPVHFTTRVMHQLFIAIIWVLGGWIHDKSTRDRFADRLHHYNGSFYAPLNVPASGDIFQLEVVYSGHTAAVKRAEIAGILAPISDEATLPRPSGMAPILEQEAVLKAISLAVDARRPVLITGPIGSGRMSIAAAAAGQRTHETHVLRWATDHTGLGAALLADVDLVHLSGLDLPAPTPTGHRTALEMIRQIIDRGELYIKPAEVPETRDAALAIVAEERGTRRPAPARLARHFLHLAAPELTDASIKSIFMTRAIKHYKPLESGSGYFVQSMTADLIPTMVSSAIELVQRLSPSCRPTSSSPHLHLSPLPTLSQFFDRFLSIRPSSIEDDAMYRNVWVSEWQSFLGGRLPPDVMDVFTRLSGEIMPLTPPPLPGADPTLIEVVDPVHVSDLDRANIVPVAADRPLVVTQPNHRALSRLAPPAVTVFPAAAEAANLCVRVLREPDHHLMVVGTPGTGRRTVTRLAARAAGYNVVELGAMVDNPADGIVQAVSKDTLALLIVDEADCPRTTLDKLIPLMTHGSVAGMFTPDVLATLDSGAEGLTDRTVSHMEERVAARVTRLIRVALIVEPTSPSFQHRTTGDPFLPTLFTPVTVHPWTTSEMKRVALPMLEEVKLDRVGPAPRLADVLVDLFAAARQISTELPALHPPVTAPPAVFIQLVITYQRHLEIERDRLTKLKRQVGDGARKLGDAHNTVTAMEADLLVLRPELADARVKSQELMVRLTADRETTETSRAVVAKEEAALQKQRQAIELDHTQAEQELAVVLPALQEAEDALKALNKGDIVEVRSFTKPPPQVVTVMSAICVVRETPPSWPAARALLGEFNFIETLVNYDKTKIPPAVLARLKRYTNDPEFSVAAMRSVSHAATSLCQWVHATVQYAEQYVIVAPRRARLQEAKSALNAAEKTLEAKRRQNDLLEAKLRDLTDEYATTTQDMERLGARIEDTNMRLHRASELTAGLEDERSRWHKQARELDVELQSVETAALWQTALMTLSLPFAFGVKLRLADKFRKVFADHNLTVDGITDKLHWATPHELQAWRARGLPPDDGSALTACVLLKGGAVSSTPTILDAERQLRPFLESITPVVPLGSPDVSPAIQSAARTGAVAIVEVGPIVPPAVSDIIEFSRAQSLQLDPPASLQLCGEMVRPTPGFRLILVRYDVVTTLPTDAFLTSPPINSAAVDESVIARLLTQAVQGLDAGLEVEADNLMVGIADDRKKIAKHEQEMLDLLNTHKGDLLADAEVVNALRELKSIATTLNQRVTESESTHRRLQLARERYVPIARRGAALFRATASLPHLNAIYRISLVSVLRTFNRAVLQIAASRPTIDEVVAAVTASLTATVSSTVAPADKPAAVLFALIEAASDMGVPAHLVHFIQSGPPSITRHQKGTGRAFTVGLPGSADPTPIPSGITEAQWLAAIRLERAIPEWTGLIDVIEAGAATSFITGFASPPARVRLLVDKHPQATRAFAMLCLLTQLRTDLLGRWIVSVAPDVLGSPFSPPVPFGSLVDESSPAHPALVLTSADFDPVVSLMSVVTNQGLPPVKAIVCGTNLDGLAESIARSHPQGATVLVQNVHLNCEWALELTKALSPLTSAKLVMTTDPAAPHPVTLVAISDKYHTTQVPSVKAVAQRLVGGVLADTIAAGRVDFNTLTALTFAHSFLVARTRFAALGWESPCVFSDGDAAASAELLASSLPDPASLIAEAVYGGKVAGDNDQLIVREQIVRALEAAAAGKSLAIDGNPVYSLPRNPTAAGLLAHIAGLPELDPPEVLGLHKCSAQHIERANAARHLSDVRRAAAALTPPVGSGDWLDIITENVPNRVIVTREVESAVDEVFMAEVGILNDLVHRMTADLNSYSVAASGAVAMSPADIELGRAARHDVVPSRWASSTGLGLAAWLTVLGRRADQLISWNEDKLNTVWLGGIARPQSLLRATLQAHARSSGRALPELSFVVQAHPGGRINTGIIVTGLTLIGAAWSAPKACIIEPLDQTAVTPLPALWLVPVNNFTPPEGLYRCPVYMNEKRGTAGLVTMLPLNCSQQPGHWTLKGTALVVEQVVDSQ